MKRIMLIKPVDHAQIGHLYEHVFCMAVYEHMKDRGLYAYHDYHLAAKAYYAGMVELSLYLYTKEAEAQEQSILALEPDFNDETVNGALTQILAEKYADIGSVDKTIVLSKLRHYQTTPWQPFDGMTVMDAANHKKARRGLELMRRSGRQFMILRQDITLDIALANSDKLTYWPLFFVLGTFLTKNLQDELANNLNCYSYDDFGHYSRRAVKETNLYRVDRRQAQEVTNEVTITGELIRKMLADGCIAKLAGFLQSTSSSTPYSSPDAEELYRRAAIIIGAAGWCKIGTEENIQHVLRHTTISFTLGKTKGILKLGDIV